MLENVPHPADPDYRDLPYSTCPRCGLETPRLNYTVRVEPCSICWSRGADLVPSSEEC